MDNIIKVARGQLAPRPTPEDELDYYLNIGSILFKSGFTSHESVDQTVAVLLYGKELGLGPMQALQSIHVVAANNRKRLVPDYKLVGAWLREHPHYDYRVLAAERLRAEVEFFRDGVSLGTSSYTWEDVQRAQLQSSMAWQRHTADMMFKTALLKGVNRYCPDVLFARGLGAADFDDIPDATTESTVSPADEFQSFMRHILSELNLTAPAELRDLMDAAGVETIEGMEDIRKLQEWLEANPDYGKEEGGADINR